MNPRRFALVMGIIFFLLGVFVFVPGLTQAPALGDPALRIEQNYGRLFGLFPVNIVNGLAYIVFGLLGISAAMSRFRSLPASINFSRFLFAACGLLSILGMFYATDTLFGYMPLFSHLVWLNGIVSLLGAYYGYSLTAQVPDMPTGTTATHEHLQGGTV